MTSLEDEAGTTYLQARQPCFFFSWISRLSARRSGKRLVPRVGLALLVFLAARREAAGPTRLLTATFSGGCKTFTIAVTGEGLKQPNPIVSYNVMLTPRVGKPIAIVDSFAVIAEQDGSFRKSIHGTWKKFEFKLTDKYTLSGSAILDSDLNYVDAMPISFSRRSLNCRRVEQP